MGPTTWVKKAPIKTSNVWLVNFYIKPGPPKLLGVFKNLVESRVLQGYKTQDQDVTLNPILQTSEEQ